MKFLPYILIIAGLAMCIATHREQLRGVITVPRTPGQTVNKSDDPERFQQVLTSEWGLGILFTTTGCVLFCFGRRAGKNKPFSSE